MEGIVWCSPQLRSRSFQPGTAGSFVWAVASRYGERHRRDGIEGSAALDPAAEALGGRMHSRAAGLDMLRPSEEISAGARVDDDPGGLFRQAFVTMTDRSCTRGARAQREGCERSGGDRSKSRMAGHGGGGEHGQGEFAAGERSIYRGRTLFSRGRRGRARESRTRSGRGGARETTTALSGAVLGCEFGGAGGLRAGRAATYERAASLAAELDDAPAEVDSWRMLRTAGSERARTREPGKMVCGRCQPAKGSDRKSAAFRPWPTRGRP